ncbi:MAG: hypothetical protein GXC94_00725 [Comamonadaceae bacterium]|jgi:hypothetical protein|nr:hypothetical protein [Comamonadaceae bacterium]
MKPVSHLISAVILSLAAASASAQFVKGNEAVSVLPDGTKKVETPPLPKGGRLPPPCEARKPGCTAAGWLMVETSQGLQECTEFYARPGTCRTSTYGSEKRPRRWIVKTGGQWMQCPRPEITSRCVSTKTLPSIEVQ